MKMLGDMLVRALALDLDFWAWIVDLIHSTQTQLQEHTEMQNRDSFF